MTDSPNERARLVLQSMGHDPDDSPLSVALIAATIKHACAMERERCAKVAAATAVPIEKKYGGDHFAAVTCRSIAAAIRSRS